MDKGEFLTVLRESLEGYIPKDEVEKNMKYYREYFNESDLSEKELLEELGDPRLIARTVIEAYKASKGPMADYYTEQARSEYSKEHSGVYEEERKEKQKETVISRIVFLFVGILIVICALVGILFLLPVVVKVVLLLLVIALFVGLFRFIHELFRN